MHQQGDGADHGDGLQIAFGPVLQQNTPQREESRGQGRLHDERQRVIHHARYRQARKVHRETGEDADDQRVAEHGRADGAQQQQAALPAIAHEFHDRDPQPVAEGGVEGDDGVIARQRRAAIGAFGDRQAQQDRIAEKAAKADGHAVFPVAAEEEPCPEDAEHEGNRRPRVEAEHQPRVEGGGQVKSRNRLKEQAGNGEILGELHHTVDAAYGKEPAPDRDIAKADHQKDRQDDIEQRLQPSAPPVVQRTQRGFHTPAPP